MMAILPAFLGPIIADAGQQAPIAEFYTDERLFVAEYINDQVLPNFSLARCRVKPGITTQLHSLLVHEWYVIESGRGLMDLDGEEQMVSVGSVVQIPQGTQQRITNTGHRDLVFFCVCMPRFTNDSYTSHE
ncbi:MAG: cupin domain-containing protein [Pseudomonadales bacterium]